jgi:hypothetical protein
LFVLPGNLEWGVSVPNSPTQETEVTNAHGIVCWDLKTQGSAGCSGPMGNKTAARSGFLAEDKPAGALIAITRAGRTWFSVNGHKGTGFATYEGFYEFDLILK